MDQLRKQILLDRLQSEKRIKEAELKFRAQYSMNLKFVLECEVLRAVIANIQQQITEIELI